MKSNLFALNTNKSFCYLTKNDFNKAFGSDRTVLVMKDYKAIKFNFEDETEGTGFVLRDVHVIGEVVRPTQLKLLNTAVKSIPDSELLFCLDEMTIDEEEADKKLKSPVKKFMSVAKKLPLFRRRMKCKKFLELDEDEREKLAATTLTFDKYKNKSMFHFINDKKLVHPSDYEEPDFITLTKPAELEYENFSSSPPSVYDLFDIDIKTDLIPENDFEPIEYEMMEYLEEEDEEL